MHQMKFRFSPKMFLNLKMRMHLEKVQMLQKLQRIHLRKVQSPKRQICRKPKK